LSHKTQTLYQTTQHHIKAKNSDLKYYQCWNVKWQTAGKLCGNGQLFTDSEDKIYHRTHQ